MDRELRDKWIAALRSGRYAQGEDCLRSNDKFCCLGVFADLIAPDDWGSVSDEYPVKWRNEYVKLPSTIIDGDAQEVLVHMNDEGADFPQIADWIEANL